MTGSATRIRGFSLRRRDSPVPPRLLSLQLILQSLGDRIRGLTFQDLFLPSNALQPKLLGEIIDFPRQPSVLGFPRPVVSLNFRLELIKRLVRRSRILEKGPVITKEEVVKELVRDVKILMLDMSSSTLKHLTTGMVTYIGGGVLLEECLAVFSQGVSDRSASSCLNKRIDTVV